MKKKKKRKQQQKTMNQGMLCFDFETCQERKLECGITLMYRRPGIRCIV